MSILDDIVIHDERRLRFTCPEDLKLLMQEYPLDNEFVDWAVAQGYNIVYDLRLNKGEGRVFWNPPAGSIYLGTNGNKDLTLIDLALAHELVHVAVPDERLSLCLWVYTKHNVGLFRRYERVIDEIAKEIVKDDDFMRYVKETMPSRTLDIKVV